MKTKLRTVSAEELRKLYEDEKLSLSQIADRFGVADETIFYKFKKLGIARRGKSESIRIRFLSKRKYQGSLEDLKKMYLEEKLSCRQIAEKLGIGRGAINYALRDSGIKMRTHVGGRKARWPNGRWGEEATNWKGGRRPVNENYIHVYKPDHPFATKQGYVMEHRLVMEEKLGRYLKPGEIVHHIDGNGKNNLPENLEVSSRSVHVHNHFAKGKYVMALEERIRQLEAEIKLLKAKG